MTDVPVIRRTWWAKLERADRHIAEFEEEFERLQHERRPYVVTTQPYKFKTGTMLEARAEPPEVYRDDLADIVGDIVFNARSALDHLCVALSGNDRSQYPIFETDPWVVSEDDQVERLNGRRRQDFQFDQTDDAKTLKLLNVVDEFTRECPAIVVERHIDADGVVACLDRLAAERGAPAYLRFDHGPEFIAYAVADWCRFNGAGTVFIDLAAPIIRPIAMRLGCHETTSIGRM